MSLKKFWRLAPVAGVDPNTIFNSPSIAPPAAPVELLARLAPRHGLVFASWDSSKLLGRVSALGIVTKIDASASSAVIDWREVDITLCPNPSGRIHWARKQYFGFAPDVVVRYMLSDLFAERFPDIELLEFSPSLRPASLGQRLPSVATPGYVYIIRSEHGYKIGKTVNLKTRTRLFEVKLPFPIQLEHYAWFDDYTSAEQNFHRMFQGKRKEGEWFALDAADIATIKTLGKAVPLEGL